MLWLVECITVKYRFLGAPREPLLDRPAGRPQSG